MIFEDNHALTERLDVIAEEQIEWRTWAQINGMNL